MSKILFPVEITENQINSFVYSAKLASALNAELILLSAIPNPPEDHGFKENQNYLNTEIQKINNFIEKLKTKYIERFSPLGDFLKIKIEYRYKEGNLMHHIFSACESENIDLIAFTLYNKRNKDERHARSLTEKFARKKVDILVLPEDSYFLHLSNIVYATDFENKISLENLEKTVKISHKFKARLHILHDQQISRDSEEFNYISKLRHSKKSKIKIYRKQNLTEIMHYIYTNEIDLMILQKKERTFFSKIFDSSFENKILIQTKIPVFILNK